MCVGSPICLPSFSRAIVKYGSSMLRIAPDGAGVIPATLQMFRCHWISNTSSMSPGLICPLHHTDISRFECSAAVEFRSWKSSTSSPDGTDGFSNFFVGSVHEFLVEHHFFQRHIPCQLDLFLKWEKFLSWARSLYLPSVRPATSIFPCRSEITCSKRWVMR